MIKFWPEQEEILNYISEWFWSLTESGIPTDKPIVEEWKCPYHNSRMCLRVMEHLA